MAFVDNIDDPKLGKEPCPNDWRVWIHCPNLKHVDNDTDMNGEWHKCAKCGRMEYADYDEMR